MYVALTGSAYQARSLTAACQRCLNLYVEALPPNIGEPIQHIHYPTPGLTLLKTAPQPIIRCLYRATTLNLYAVAGQGVYYVDADWTWHLLGSLHPSAPKDAMPRTTPISMNDNGSILLIADGSLDGWFIDLTQPLGTQSVTRIDPSINTGWLGADFITYQDTFFILNSPGTNIYYISVSYPTASSLIAAYQVRAATVVNGGPGTNAGYSVGDVLYLDGTGTSSGTGGTKTSNATDAQVTVYGVDIGGGITQQQVTYGGVVATQPVAPVAVIGGTGQGATFSLTYGPGAGAFDPLNYAAKSAMTDDLVAAVSIHRVVWLIGTSSYELWQNTGGDGTFTGSFPFQILYGAFGNFGCAAKYSIAVIMNEVFWLSQDQYGRGMIMRGSGLSATRISTHAIETQIGAYPIIKDAVAYTYQQTGHAWYVINFPSANDFKGATWCFDASSNQWSERCWIDANGLEYRHRANCATEAYGSVIVGDWENSNLMALSLSNYTDLGLPIKRLRSFPHQIEMQGNRRVRYDQVIANMQVGTSLTMASGTEVFVESEFLASDGTLLQNYRNQNDVGAEFTQIDSTNSIEVIDDKLIGLASGTSQYQVAGVPTITDYQVQFNVLMSSGIPPANSTLYAVARADGSHNGYLIGVVSDGSNVFLKLQVMGTVLTPSTVPLGALSSGAWRITLILQGSTLAVSVYRLIDSLYLTSAGGWQGSPQVAISLIDSTYTAPGVVLLGGNWA